jgi:DNA segregation ATPase FtsK/SpoIIIE-like protein
MSKNEEKQENGAKTKKKGARFAQELWGVVFFALGLLILISLISFFASGSENILGPYLGTALSRGLVYLFGVVPSFLVPLCLMFIGAKNLKGAEISAALLVFLSALIVEVSLLVAIRNLPQLCRGSFSVTDNYIGNAFTYSLHYPFGGHRFGPYFLTLFAVFITVLLCFRINPVKACVALFVFIKSAGLWTASFFRRLFTKQKELPASAARMREKEARPKNQETAEEEEERREEGEELDRERQLAQEKELAAFRAKLSDPVRITTMGVPQDGDDAADEAEEAAIDEEETPARHKAAPALKRPKAPQKPYTLPSPDVLSDPPETSLQIDKDSILSNSQILEKTLLNFGLEGKVFNVCSGPVVTRYEIELAPGVKVSRVINLQNDIAMAVGGQKIRIEAPIPGKAAIGIELPNPEKQIVHFKHILLSEAFKKSKAKLPMIIGQNISGVPYVTDIVKMPHLLVAGQTGSGKSVCMNAILCSLLMTKTPEELRLVMVDPKKVELAIYEDIPHLMSPVVSEPKEAVKALFWAVMEIQRRFNLLKKLRGARDIESFNTRILMKNYEEGLLTEDEAKPLPLVVIFVDELADLMLTASKDVESHILRIAQLGRAAGIHLVVATQRPSVDIITGPIKANLASRIAFRTIQATDSRTILGHQGAEQLLGMGDMLFLRNGAPDVERYHGAYISEQDVEKIVAEINKQKFEMEKFESFHDQVEGDGAGGPGGYGGEGRDELFEEAARMIVSIGQGSTSLLQRRMKIGYARAGRVMDELEQAGIVGQQEGSKMREVLMKTDELEVLLQRLRSGAPLQEQQ